MNFTGIKGKQAIPESDSSSLSAGQSDLNVQAEVDLLNHSDLFHPVRNEKRDVLLAVGLDINSVEPLVKATGQRTSCFLSQVLESAYFCG